MMKKNFIIMSLVLLVLSMSGAMAFADTADITTANYDFGAVSPGTTQSNSFSVTNTGANNISALTINLKDQIFYGSSGRVNSSITPNFVPPAISDFAAAAVKQVNYSFEIPNVFADTYTGTFAINSAGTELDTTTITYTISPNYSMTFSDLSLSAIAGESASGNLVLNNNGNTDLAGVVFTLNNLVKSGSSDYISKNAITIGTSVNVNYGENSLNHAISVNVPSGTSAGTYSGNIVATYHGTSSVTKTLSVVVTAENYHTAITSSDIIWAKGITTSLPINFNITNDGNKLITTETCTIGDFKTSSGTSAIANSLFSTSTISVSNLAVNDVSSQTFSLNSVPSDLVFGDYTATISCTNSADQTVKLTYRNKSTALTIPEELIIGGSSSSRNETQTQTYTITNSGDTTISNIVLTISSSKDVRFVSGNSTTYTISSLGAGASTDVSLTYFVPYSADAKKESLGTLVLSSSSLDQDQTTRLYVQAENMLDIDDIYMKVDGGSKNTLNPDSTSNKDDINPGSEIKVYVKVKSLFSDNDDYEQDIEIGNVMLNVIIDKLDIDIDSDEYTVKADDSETMSIIFDLPYELKYDDYDLEITVTGEDDESAVHETTFNVNLNVNRESRELIILDDQTAFDIDDVSCDSIAYLDTKVINTGNKDLDNVKLTVSNSELNFKYTEFEDQLTNDYGNSNSEIEINSLPIDLKSLGAKAKTYSFVIDAYYDNTKRLDSHIVSLTCSGESSTNSDDNNADVSDNKINIISSGKNDQAGNSIFDESINSSDSEKSNWDSFRDSNAYVAVLALTSIALIGGFSFVAFKL